MTAARAVPAATLAFAALAFGLSGCGETVPSDPVSPNPPPPPPQPEVTVTADPATDNQSGVVGTTLGLPLRVTVRSDGVPKDGVAVNWSAPEGSLNPSTAITDAFGVARAVMVLGTTPGSKSVTAVAAGGANAVATFTMTALAGSAVAIAAEYGDGQALPANRPAFSSLIARVTDQYGNPVAGQPVSWLVESGPVRWVTEGGATDAGGRSAAVVAPIGLEGAALVRAALPGGSAAAEFALVVEPPLWQVALKTIGDYHFVSAQNGTTPAVDTILVGTTMEWVLDPYDWDDHALVPVGLPSFVGGDFLLTGSVSVTFDTPGTYEYKDDFTAAAGTLVVK